MLYKSELVVKHQTALLNCTLKLYFPLQQSYVVLKYWNLNPWIKITWEITALHKNLINHVSMCGYLMEKMKR